MPHKTAYVTGAASGIGRALTYMLHRQGIRVVVADRNLEGAKELAGHLDQDCKAVEVDVGSWDSQVTAFETAVEVLGRIDYVFPIAGIGERAFLQNDGRKTGQYSKPDLSVLEVDLTGFMYTAALAIQQMRRQDPDETGYRGKIAGTASVCGFYCVPTLPVYTAAKHGVVGFVRSYGKYLPEEHITLNAVCPHVLRTSISTSEFYDKLEDKGLIVKMDDVIDAFESLLDSSMSGECLECSPKGGFQRRASPEIIDRESAELNELLYERAHPLHSLKKSDS